MSEERTIYKFHHFRILARYLFGAVCMVPAVFLWRPLQSMIGIDAIALVLLILIVIVLFLAGCTIAAYVPLFRKEGEWYVENDVIHILPAKNRKEYIVENLQELYFSDPLMPGAFMNKKCVLEIRTDSYILSMQSGPISRSSSRKDSELWKLFAEIRNRNLKLQRVNDTEGHLVDYWYRKPKPKRPKPVRDERFWR